MSETMQITYHWEGDYQIPDITMPLQPTAPLGKYGRMRKDYVQTNQPILFNRLVMSGKLYSHLLEIDQAANNRMEQMMESLARSSGATETMKAKDQMGWVRLMNSLRQQAEEIILNELIYA